VIVVDASAVLAILLREPESQAFSVRLLQARGALISPVNYWEVMVRARAEAGDTGVAEAEALLAVFNVQIAQIDPIQAQTAIEASVRFGKSTPAKLNLGDCFAYALAKREGDGLLFKGNDFPQTDIAAAG
jgi:ribonuclease VapC